MDSLKNHIIALVNSKIQSLPTLRDGVHAILFAKRLETVEMNAIVDDLLSGIPQSQRELLYAFYLEQLNRYIRFMN